MVWLSILEISRRPSDDRPILDPSLLADWPGRDRLVGIGSSQWGRDWSPAPSRLEACGQVAHHARTWLATTLDHRPRPFDETAPRLPRRDRARLPPDHPVPGQTIRRVIVRGHAIDIDEFPQVLHGLEGLRQTFAVEPFGTRRPLQGAGAPPLEARSIIACMSRRRLGRRPFAVKWLGGILFEPSFQQDDLLLESLDQVEDVRLDIEKRFGPEFVRFEIATAIGRALGAFPKRVGSSTAARILPLACFSFQVLSYEALATLFRRM